MLPHDAPDLRRQLVQKALDQAAATADVAEKKRLLDQASRHATEAERLERSEG